MGTRTSPAAGRYISVEEGRGPPTVSTAGDRILFRLAIRQRSADRTYRSAACDTADRRLEICVWKPAEGSGEHRQVLALLPRTEGLDRMIEPGNIMPAERDEGAGASLGELPEVTTTESSRFASA